MYSKGKEALSYPPFTHEVTNFHQIKKGTVVNLEFDILGKYIAKIVRQVLSK